MKHVDFIGNSWSGSISSLHINRQVAIKSQDSGFKRVVSALSAICFTQIIIQSCCVFSLSLFLLQSNIYYKRQTHENINHDLDITESLTLLFPSSLSSFLPSFIHLSFCCKLLYKAGWVISLSVYLYLSIQLQIDLIL